MTDIMSCLERAVKDQASDLFIVAGGAVNERCEGRIHAIDEEKLFPAQTEEMIRELYTLSKRSIDEYIAHGDDDFSFAVPKLARFRVNTYRQRGSMAAVIRTVSFDIPDWHELHIPEEIISLANVTSGLILVTGTAGSGKSTTQACIIDQINRTRNCHIITLEDPIEYLHRNQKSIISQREITIDTPDYHSALRACLRQSPDVILLGEMRDHETIRTAMTAAETGHLVIATLHTSGAVSTIDRIVDTFQPTQQEQIRIQLSTVLHTIISQQLLPDKDGNQVPAYEVMHMNSAISNLIRESKNHQIDNHISSGKAEGMFSMDQSIFSLWQNGIISKETALVAADHPDQLRRRLDG